MTSVIVLTRSFRNYTWLIAKLVQTTTVADYHATFERYLNRVEDLTESALIPIFIQGLKQPLQEKVELQQPASLAEAMELALRLAATQEERQQQSSSFSRRQWSGRETRTSLAPSAPGGQHQRDKLARETELVCSQFWYLMPRNRRGPAVTFVGIARRSGYQVILAK